MPPTLPPSAALRAGILWPGLCSGLSRPSSCRCPFASPPRFSLVCSKSSPFGEVAGSLHQIHPGSVRMQAPRCWRPQGTHLLGWAQDPAFLTRAWRTSLLWVSGHCVVTTGGLHCVRSGWAARSPSAWAATPAPLLELRELGGCGFLLCTPTAWHRATAQREPATSAGAAGSCTWK